MIARTETVRAHHKATIGEYRQAEAIGITVKAEFQTRSGNPCPECSALEGQIFTIDEADDLIPVHPNCYCVTLPVDLTEARKAS
jgi:SPP1 gp7 family putative phage head morphogenesis protein